MKKLVSGGIAVMLLLAAVGIVLADGSGRTDETSAVQQQVSNVNDSTILTTKEAVRIAENEVDGIVKELELDRENGRMVYEIEMHTGTKEVELKIDASSGEIIKFEEEWDNDRKYKALQNKQATEQNKVVEEAPIKDKPAAKQSNPAEGEQAKPAPAQTKQVAEPAEPAEPTKPTTKQVQQTKPAKQTQTKQTKPSVIGTEEAIRIAKTIADGKIEEVELDKDDGRLIYEIEIENRTYEVEIEIDAYTGEILDVEYDD